MLGRAWPLGRGPPTREGREHLHMADSPMSDKIARASHRQCANPVDFMFRFRCRAGPRTARGGGGRKVSPGRLCNLAPLLGALSGSTFKLAPRNSSFVRRLVRASCPMPVLMGPSGRDSLPLDLPPYCGHPRLRQLRTPAPMPAAMRAGPAKPRAAPRSPAKPLEAPRSLRSPAKPRDAKAPRGPMWPRESLRSPAKPGMTPRSLTKPREAP